MELRHLRYFVAVAEEGHFGRAARRLFISQPPLSRQIRDLEEELGVELLERRGPRFRLTDAGQQFLEGARQTLAQAERATGRARQAARGVAGFLSIGYTPTGDLQILPRILKPFHRAYPGVQLELRILPPTPQIEDLRRERIHVGFLRMPVDAPDLRIEHVCREPLLLAIPERHPLARRRRIRLSSLAQEPFLMFPRPLAPSYYDELIGFFRGAGFSPLIAHELESLQTMLALVAAGLGLALLPSSIRDIRRSGVVYRDLLGHVPHVDMAVAYLERNRSEVLRQFLDVVRTCYPGRRGR
jgi:DNA-binding transcriptional LysR family regulator